jgi:hypothetical protein
MALSKGLAQSYVPSECSEAVIVSEFSCALEKDIPSIFSQFTNRKRLGMNSFAVNEIFIFRIFV